MKSYDLKICMIFNLFIEISQIKNQYRSFFLGYLDCVREFFSSLPKWFTSVTYLIWLLAEVRYGLMQFASHQTIQLRDFLGPAFSWFYLDCMVSLFMIRKGFEILAEQALPMTLFTQLLTHFSLKVNSLVVRERFLHIHL